jgi:hypothetical protein
MIQEYYKTFPEAMPPVRPITYDISIPHLAPLPPAQPENTWNSEMLLEEETNITRPN